MKRLNNAVFALAGIVLCLGIAGCPPHDPRARTFVLECPSHTHLPTGVPVKLLAVSESADPSKENATYEWTTREAGNYTFDPDVATFAVGSRYGFWEAETSFTSMVVGSVTVRLLRIADITGKTEEKATCTMTFVEPPCSSEGDTKCDGEVVRTCTDSNGRLVWRTTEVCEDDTPVCDDSSSTAQCVAECTPGCPTEGNTRCSGENIQTCTDVEGCLVWLTTEACEDDTPFCDDSSDTAQCVAECTPDCPTEGDTRCSDENVQTCTDVEGCLLWRTTEACEDDTPFCDDSSGTAQCVAECTPDCPTEGDTRCSDENVQTCTDVEGCLLWRATEACEDDTPDCDDSSGTAQCVGPCTSVDCGGHGDCVREGEGVSCDCDDGYLAQDLICVPAPTCEPDSCTEPNRGVCDDTSGVVVCSCDAGYDEDEAGDCVAICNPLEGFQCHDGAREFCDMVSGAGPFWTQLEDCTAAGRECVSTTSASAECGAMLLGNDCTDPLPVTALPYVFSGSSFGADFADDLTLSGAGCLSGGSAPEAVFQVSLSDGQQLVIRETGDLDAILSVQRSCGATAACEVSSDEDELSGVLYTAQGSETVFVVLEHAGGAAPDTVPYELRLDLYADEICDDSNDNDIDALTDCDDPDCFGLTGCESELNCTDGQDNNDDGLTDCDDPDCFGLTGCESELNCTDGQDNDNDGDTDGADADCPTIGQIVNVDFNILDAQDILHVGDDGTLSTAGQTFWNDVSACVDPPGSLLDESGASTAIEVKFVSCDSGYRDSEPSVTNDLLDSGPFMHDFRIVNLVPGESYWLAVYAAVNTGFRLTDNSGSEWIGCTKIPTYELPGEKGKDYCTVSVEPYYDTGTGLYEIKIGPVDGMIAGFQIEHVP